MEFEVKKREYEEGFNHEATKASREFAKRLYHEMNNFIKAIVLFGSSVRKENPNDIDILVIVDDVSYVLGREVVETYRIVVEKILADMGHQAKKLHITTLKFATFFEYVKVGDPIGLNILRDGIPLIETGNFFYPLKLLLRQGRLRPSEESIWTYYGKVNPTMHNANWHITQATIDLYWAVTDAAHAALMRIGEMPPTPGHIAGLMREKMVKTKMIDAKYADIVEKFYHTTKKIETRQIQYVTGKAFDKFNEEAKEFVNEMKKIIEKKPTNKK